MIDIYVDHIEHMNIIKVHDDTMSKLLQNVMDCPWRSRFLSRVFCGFCTILRLACAWTCQKAWLDAAPIRTWKGLEGLPRGIDEIHGSLNGHSSWVQFSIWIFYRSIRAFDLVMSPELPWMRAGLLHATEKRWTKKNVETILQSNSSTAGVFKFPCNHQLMMIHIDTVLMLQVSVWLIDLSYV